MKNKISQYYQYIKKDWWLYLTLLIYIILIGIIIYYHEAWTDEAHVWLISRDSTSFFELLFTNLRYVGHPSLWYIFLRIVSKFHLPYFAMNILSGAIATIGIYVFLRYSPFPKIIKILFPFSFFLFYQYAVLARNYVLLPLLLFIIAIIYKDKTKKIYLFILLLALLVNLSVHSLLIAISLFLTHLIDLYEEWPHLDKKLRIKQIKAALVFAFIIGLIGIQMLPQKDSFWGVRYNYNFSNFLKLSPIILNNAMTGVMGISLLVLIISLFWFYKKKTLLLFLIPSLAILSFFSVVVFKAWHEGILTLVWIFAMWISFERDNIKNNKLKYLKILVILSIIILLSFQIFWSFKNSINDINGPYSAGKSIAEYIRNNKLEDKKIYATSFYSISILPYFDEVIFDNYYYPNKSTRNLWLRGGEVIEDYETILKHQPDLIILGAHQHLDVRATKKDKEALLNNPNLFIYETPINEIKEIPGYSFEGIFEGNMYWKDGIQEKNYFVLFRKE